MESENPRQCQWKQCIDTAVKHVVFGLRVFDARPGTLTHEARYKVDHLDLCRKHAGLASLQYVHVTEYELDACPGKHGDIDPR